jgi:hypothetical protein
MSLIYSKQIIAENFDKDSLLDLKFACSGFDGIGEIKDEL